MTSKENQMATTRKPKRPVGRPPLEFPEGIDATPEEIAFKVMNTPPKREGEWEYQKVHRAERERRQR